MPDDYTQIPLALETKRCTDCEEVKPLDAFHHHRSRADGRAAYCKICKAARAAAYRAANPEKEAARLATWYAANRERQAAKSAAYRAANQASVAAQKAAWEAANREANAAKHAAWRAAHRDSIVTRRRVYRLTSPEKANAPVMRYRARKRGVAISDMTAAQWTEIKKAYDGRCAYCGCAPDILTQDHVVPLSRGGNHTASNIVPACQPCNSSKNNRLPSEWKGRMNADH